ncbi:MAG: response regulator [Deltaproteobacteria bacterium]|nr:response regulator [Deltaproteobacteria bacterium]
MAHRVLVVDDEPSIVLSLQYLLQREGFEVDTAADGEAALEVVARRPPALVVLDIMLPTMSGFEVCRRLRADPAAAGIKVLMLTARGRDTEAQKGLRLGADLYLTKPFSTHELLEHVRRLLGQTP